jgi:hypothetical protein
MGLFTKEIKSMEDLPSTAIMTLFRYRRNADEGS